VVQYSEAPPSIGLVMTDPASEQNARWFQCGRFRFDVSETSGRPLVMGILNLTPDSFSDGGHYLDPEQALRRARVMVEQGADILDIGAESTRPGAQPATVQQELDRILPVLAALKSLPVALSVDTRKPEVMQASLEAGADLLNDVEGFRSLCRKPDVFHELVALIRQKEAGLCIMHMQGDPLTMQKNPTYRDAVAEVCQFLQTQANALCGLGVAMEQVVLDPGIGFGKSLEHNQSLMNRLREIVRLGYPVLMGVSRKSVLGLWTGKPVEQRLAASLAAALWSIARGASIVRVHDVGETVDALKVWRALQARGLDGLRKDSHGT
jgi:dihydropteroate synthase